MDSTETPPRTVFRFTAEGVDIEFAGSEAFVEKQIERYRAFLESAVTHGASAPSAPAAPSRAPAAAPSAPMAATAEAPSRHVSLQEFYDEHPTRGGRGAIQDRILLFTYFLQLVQGKHSVSKDDIAWCFQQVGLGVPKNLLNALGNMKRKLGLLQGGGRRGLYQVSPQGRRMVEQRFQ